jgi:hypothetical protein
VINQLLKLGVFITLGVWLKHRGKGLFVLLLVLILTWLGHNEYLSYIEQSGDKQYLGLSYAIKWSIFVFAVGLYYFLVERRLGSGPEQERNTISQPEENETRSDGFDFLRQKRTLESESEKSLKNPLGK